MIILQNGFIITTEYYLQSILKCQTISMSLARFGVCVKAGLHYHSKLVRFEAQKYFLCKKSPSLNIFYVKKALA